MSSAYLQLLDATIAHLQQLQARRQRTVQVSAELLAELGRPVSRPVAAAPAARPVSTAPASFAAPAATAPAPAPRPTTPPPAPVPSRPAIQVEPAAPAPAGAGGVAPGMSRAAREAALAEVRARALACTRCPHLVSSRTQVVFGVGNPEARLMFVGEAPGADEDRQGEPFVGLAGQLLTKIIQAMGLSRSDIYIGNVLKCRPNMPPGAPGNRKPTADEMVTCLPFLREQISIIQPVVLVGLGATAVEGLLGRDSVAITRLRGNWQRFGEIPLMPTFHPSYLQRTNSIADKRKVWEDMMQVMDKLGMPISERQRAFFLRAPAAGEAG